MTSLPETDRSIDEADVQRGGIDGRLSPILRLTSRLTDAPMAAIGEMAADGLTLKAAVGVHNLDWPLASAFARLCGDRSEPFFTGDVASDPSAAALSAQADGVRFFAVVPLLAAGGRDLIGLLFVADPRPRATVGAGERQALLDLAAAAAEVMARDLAESQRETLITELDHRIKNVLSAVQSLALQSARKAGSLEGFLKTFTGRLKSMASAHQLLTATRWRGAGMRNIAAAELGGLAPGQTRWEGPDLLLTPRAANAISLALHELATNAMKFGALSVDAGRVAVRWYCRPEGGLTLEWTETDGPPVAAPVRHGFGSTLLEKVTGRELGGRVKLDYRRDGVHAVLDADQSAIAEAVSGASEPVAEAPSPVIASPAPFAAQPVRINGLRILVVEDALLLALELEAGLQEAGAQIVGSAADLDEAMRMVDLPLDAAVLDANLNGVSVVPVAEALAARGIPFVFATGYGDSKMAPHGFNAPVIRKPYDVTQVAAALAEVTGRA